MAKKKSKKAGRVVENLPRPDFSEDLGVGSATVGRGPEIFAEEKLGESEQPTVGLAEAEQSTVEAAQPKHVAKGAMDPDFAGKKVARSPKEGAKQVESAKQAGGVKQAEGVKRAGSIKQAEDIKQAAPKKKPTQTRSRKRRAGQEIAKTAPSVAPTRSVPSTPQEAEVAVEAARAAVEAVEAAIATESHTTKVMDKTAQEAPKQPMTRKKKKIASEASKKALEEPTIETRFLRSFLKIVLSVLFLAGMAVALALFLLSRTVVGSSVGEFIGENVGVFILNCLVIFGVLGIFASLLWRPFFATGIMFAIISIFSFINTQKYSIRNMPFLPEDFAMAGQAGGLMEFIDVGELVRMIIGVILVLVGTFLVDFYLRRFMGVKQRKLPWWQKYSVIQRVGFASLSALVLVGVASPVVEHAAGPLGMKIGYITWDKTQNYEANGFLVSFLYNLAPVEREKLEDYNAAKMASIAKIYRQKKAEDKAPRKTLDKIAENLIIILDESFVDPAILQKYYGTTSDVTPRLHEIMQKYPSGYMFSPEYGGSTGNVEFEVTTGLSNYWYQGVPFDNPFPTLGSVLAAPSYAKGFGFETISIHSYNDYWFSRRYTHPVLGIDTLRFEETFTYQEAEGNSPYLNDRSLFKEALDELNSSDSPQMMTLITMQSHAPYDSPDYPVLHYWPTDAHEENFMVASAFEVIHKADEYLGEFLDALDELDEKTVVLVFGDHAPGTLHAYTSSESDDERRLSRITPYFIYANFDIESTLDIPTLARTRMQLGIELDLDEEMLETIDLPVTTPNCLLNTFYNILGAEKPALMYLLDEVCQETPILSQAYFAERTPKETAALQAYKLVNYDVLSGQHFWDGE